MSQEMFGRAVAGCTVRAGSKRRSGWRSMAPPAHMTTIPNRPETANRRKEAAQRLEVSSPADTRPAKCRSRTEYCEELRAADQQMAASDGHSDRPPLDSQHVTPERQAHPRRGSLGRRAPAQDRQARENGIPAASDNKKVIGHVLDVTRAPATRPSSRPTADQVSMAILFRSVFSSSSCPTAESGPHGPTPAASGSSGTRGSEVNKAEAIEHTRRSGSLADRVRPGTWTECDPWPTAANGRNWSTC